MQIDVGALELLPAETSGLLPCNPKSTCGVGASCSKTCIETCSITG